MAFVNIASLCVFAITFMLVVGHSDCNCKRKHKRKCPEVSTPIVSSTSRAPVCNSTECSAINLRCYCIYDDDAPTSVSHSVPKSGDCKELEHCSVCYKIGRKCDCIKDSCECLVADPGPPPKPHSICPLTSTALISPSERSSTITSSYKTLTLKPTTRYVIAGACKCIRDDVAHTTHILPVGNGGLCAGVQPCSICYCIPTACNCYPPNLSCCKPLPHKPLTAPSLHSICPLNSTATTVNSTKTNIR